MASNPAEQNVDYWRGRWADTASALTDAINERREVSEKVTTCVGLLRTAARSPLVDEGHRPADDHHRGDVMATEEPFRCGECGGEIRDHVCVDCGTRHG